MTFREALVKSLSVLQKELGKLTTATSPAKADCPGFTDILNDLSRAYHGPSDFNIARLKNTIEGFLVINK